MYIHTCKTAFPLHPDDKKSKPTHLYVQVHTRTLTGYLHTSNLYKYVFRTSTYVLLNWLARLQLVAAMTSFKHTDHASGANQQQLAPLPPRNGHMYMYVCTYIQCWCREKKKKKKKTKAVRLNISLHRHRYYVCTYIHTYIHSSYVPQMQIRNKQERK